MARTRELKDFGRHTSRRIEAGLGVGVSASRRAYPPRSESRCFRATIMTVGALTMPRDSPMAICKTAQPRRRSPASLLPRVFRARANSSASRGSISRSASGLLLLVVRSEHAGIDREALAPRECGTPPGHTGGRRLNLVGDVRQHRALPNPSVVGGCYVREKRAAAAARADLPDSRSFA